jgi:hypothetical protein
MHIPILSRDTIPPARPSYILLRLQREKFVEKIKKFVEKIFSFPHQFIFNKFSTPAFHSAFRILHFGGLRKWGRY